MTADPDAAATAALDACYASATDTIPEIVDTALAYARPLIEAAARASERQRIINDLRTGDRFAWYRDAANCIADLLGG